MSEHPHEPLHYVAPMWMYITVFLSLLVLTGLTVFAAQHDLGVMNTPVALAIATVKASLVILFFMHVFHSTRLTWVVIIASFLWLGVLFVLTFADYLTRTWGLQ
ncbi:MAG TPA: cytochrome C oxidase subunit IV family protein [Thermoanaerobaculia bacterium]|nr:cytochrome C oxidase subunit IV family protein [Thermoanaerobaculia bacterium]